MHANKALMLALAAAGLAGSANAPLARSDGVFVPELALIDGAICRPPAANGLPLLWYTSIKAATSIGTRRKTSSIRAPVTDSITYSAQGSQWNRSSG